MPSKRRKGRKARPKTYRRWRCTGKKCDFIIESRIPLIEAYCPHGRNHSSGGTISMRPIRD